MDELLRSIARATSGEFADDHSKEDLLRLLSTAEHALRAGANDADDAARLRWMLAGNGYFMEEEMLCGHGPCSDQEQAEARRRMDEQMKAQGWALNARLTAPYTAQRTDDE